MQPYQEAFIEFLLEAEALRVGEFTLKSGRTSPVFLNTGLLDTGSRLQRLGRAYAETALARLGEDGFDTVFGPAYKGIPLGVATVIGLAEKGVEKATLSDRKEAKAHGAEAASGSSGKRLLGRPPADGTRFILVDDVLSTGQTKIDAVAMLRELVPGCRFEALLIVLDRMETTPAGEDAVQQFTDSTGVPVHPILRLTDTVDYLRTKGHMSAEDHQRCKAYWGEYGTADAKAWAGATVG